MMTDWGGNPKLGSRVQVKPEERVLRLIPILLRVPVEILLPPLQQEIPLLPPQQEIRLLL